MKNGYDRQIICSCCHLSDYTLDILAHLLACISKLILHRLVWSVEQGRNLRHLESLYHVKPINHLALLWQQVSNATLYDINKFSGRIV